MTDIMREIQRVIVSTEQERGLRPHLLEASALFRNSLLHDLRAHEMLSVPAKDEPETVMGIPIKVSENVPEGEAWFYHGPDVVGRIVDID